MLYTHVFFTTLSSGANEYMKDHIFELRRKIILSSGLVTVIRREKIEYFLTGKNRKPSLRVVESELFALCFKPRARDCRMENLGRCVTNRIRDAKTIKIRQVSR